MTAHAVRALATLHMAPRHQRALLDIEVLVSAARWLVIEQQQSGAFRETTLAADQRFNDTSDVILTSHVLLALTEVLRAADRGDDSEEDVGGDSEVGKMAVRREKLCFVPESDRYKYHTDKRACFYLKFLQHTRRVMLKSWLIVDQVLFWMFMASNGEHSLEKEFIAELYG